MNKRKSDDQQNAKVNLISSVLDPKLGNKHVAFYISCVIKRSFYDHFEKHSC